MAETREELIKQAEEQFRNHLIDEANFSYKSFSHNEPPPSNIIDDTKDVLKNIGGKILNGVSKVGETYDRFVSAPPRSALGAMLNGQNPIAAYTNQFGKDPKLAPTGKEIAGRIGFPDTENIDIGKHLLGPGVDIIDPNHNRMNVSPSGMAGLVIDVAADPTNIIPLSSMGKFAIKGAGTAISEGKNILAKGADALTGKNYFSTTNEFVNNATRAAKDGLSKFVNPTVAEDAGKYIDIAERNGIDPNILPESVKYGPDSFIARGATAVREGVTGEPEKLKNIQAHAAVHQAIEKKIDTFSNGLPKNEIDAGNAIIDGFNEAKDNVFKQVDFTYNSIAQQVPGMQIGIPEQAKLQRQITELDKLAKYRANMGVTFTQQEQANQILRATSSVKFALEPKLNMSVDQINGLKKSLDNLSSTLGSTSKSETQNAIYSGFLKNIQEGISKINSGLPNNGRINGRQMASLQNLVSNVQEMASGLGKRGIPGGKQSIVSNLDRALTSASANQSSFADMVLALQNVGDAAFEKASLRDVTPEVKKMRDIYFGISEALQETVKKNLGDDIYNSLKINNESLSEFFKDSSPIKKAIENKDIAPERLFNTLINNGDSKRIESIINTLPQEKISQIKAAFLDNLIQKRPDGSFPYRTFYNALENKDPVVKTLFSAEEISDFKDLLILGDRMGPPISSLPGSGMSGEFRNIGNSFKDAIYNRTILDFMKNRASNASPLSSVPEKLNYTRTPLEKGLKASQVISVDKNNRDYKNDVIQRQLLNSKR